MPRLVVGPLLRYVDESTATIWVETDEPCSVYVLGASADTFTVHGHHYALVDVEGLAPGSSIPYTVELDGHTVWPPPRSPFPPSRIRTRDPAGPVRLATGSCRRDGPHHAADTRALGMDALRAYGQRLAESDGASWPSALLLLGDQVYADNVPDAMGEVIASRRDPEKPPGWEVADFEEYTHLYRLAWTDPVIRWVLSTVPSMMILDDHDIRDDWNISRDWQRWIEAQPWWQARLTGGLGAYWIYQHLGNLSPQERATDPLVVALRAAGSTAGTPPGSGDGNTTTDWGAVLDELARGADRDGRWSFARDFGPIRLVVLDSRGGRALEPRARRMLGPAQLSWFDERAHGDVDHLLIATSTPYLLPLGVHHLEAWNEAICEGAWGGWAAAPAERLRQEFDLEHWASFQYSFAAVAEIVSEVATGHRGGPPASITFLSGDVHYSYLARAHLDPPQTRTGGAAEPPAASPSPVHQVVCSPIRNVLPFKLRTAVRVAATPVTGALGALLARAARVRTSPLSWRTVRGNWFANALATLELHGRGATVRWDSPHRTHGMRHLATSNLT